MHRALGKACGSLWRAYESQLQRRPLTTNVATSAVLWRARAWCRRRWRRNQHTSPAQAAAAGSCRPFCQGCRAQTAAEDVHAGSCPPPGQAARGIAARRRGAAPLPAPRSPPAHTHKARARRSAGDCLAQYIERNKRLDVKRTALTAAFAATLVGPVGHWW